MFDIYKQFICNYTFGGISNFNKNYDVSDSLNFSSLHNNYVNSIVNLSKFSLIKNRVHGGLLDNRLLSYKISNSLEYFYKNNDDLDMSYIFKFLLPDIVSTRNLNKFSSFNIFFNSSCLSNLSDTNVDINYFSISKNNGILLFNFNFFKNCLNSSNTGFVDVNSFIGNIGLKSNFFLFNFSNFGLFKKNCPLPIYESNFFFKNFFNFNIIDLATNNFYGLYSNKVDNFYLSINDSISNQKRLNISKGILLPSDINIHIICGSKDVIHS